MTFAQFLRSVAGYLTCSPREGPRPRFCECGKLLWSRTRMGGAHPHSGERREWEELYCPLCPWHFTWSYHWLTGWSEDWDIR